jgi:hypothetical protein
MISESINYVQKSEEWLKTVIIGGILTLLGVTSFLVIGYLMRVVRLTMAGDEEPPAFDDWESLAIDGLKGLVVSLVYVLIPGLLSGALFTFGALSFFGGISGESAAATAFGGVVLLVGFLVALVLGLAAAYIVPAAIAILVETDSIGAAFSYRRLKPALLSGKYATAWLMGAAVVIGASVLVGIVSAIPIIGVLGVLGVFVTFYSLVSAYYIIGTTWAEMYPVEIQDDGQSPDERPMV